MNSELVPKVVVASGIAVVVGIIAVTTALRSPHPMSQRTAAVAQIPDAPAPVAPIPDTPAPVAQIPEAPAPVTPTDSVGAKVADTATPAAVEPKVARSQHPAKSRISSDTETLAESVHGASSVKEQAMPVALNRTATDAQIATSTEPAASDSSITTDVKSQLAADRISKDFDIGVTTTQGVVVLTGTLVTQDAIDHVKDITEKVKDVKSVDTSAMKITST